MTLASPAAAFRRRMHAIVVAAILAPAASCDDTAAGPPNTGPLIVLSPPSASIAVGDSVAFSASGKPLGGYRWTTSAPAVAAVSAAGVVRALAPGRSTITVATVDDQSVRAAAVVEIHPP
jgi:hypothetical protein